MPTPRPPAATTYDTQPRTLPVPEPCAWGSSDLAGEVCDVVAVAGPVAGASAGSLRAIAAWGSRLSSSATMAAEFGCSFTDDDAFKKPGALASTVCSPGSVGSATPTTESASSLPS